jgi:hypothetical protein
LCDVKHVFLHIFIIFKEKKLTEIFFSLFAHCKVTLFTIEGIMT